MSSAALEKTAGELSEYLGRRPGRPRKVEVTLASYTPDDPNDTKPTGRPKGETPRGWTYRNIDDSTLAQREPLDSYENITQLTEIFEESFTSLAASQDRKMEMLKRNTPAKPKAGKKNKKFTIGDATPERFKHAKQAGMQLVTEKETFDDGRETGIQHKRFRGILEVWHRKEVIDKATFAAAETFQRDCDLSLSASPRMISRYGHILPSGVPELLPQEIQVEFEARKRAAIKAVDRRLHFILAWIAEVSNTEVHPDTVAEKYWPHIGQKSRTERFKALLEYVCMILSVHYGQVDEKRHRWVRLSISRAAEEVYDLLNA